MNVFAANVDIPEFLHAQAQKIARDRTQRNSHIVDPYYHRGDKSEYLDYIGILAELIVRWWCDTHGVKYTATPLLADKPVADCDISINGVSYDIKGMDAPNKVYVNERAHKKKQCDAYMFVLIGDTATVYVESYAAVDQWPVRNLTYTPAYVGKLIEEDF